MLPVLPFTGDCWFKGLDSSQLKLLEALVGADDGWKA